MRDASLNHLSTRQSTLKNHRRKALSSLYSQASKKVEVLPGMLTLLAICHVIFAILLVCLVLLQDPKNASGGLFGGGSSGNTLLGATGGATFLTKLTAYTAILFGITCLVITLLLRPTSGSVLDADTNPPPINNTTAPAPAEQQGGAPTKQVPGSAAPEIPPPQTKPAK